MEDPDPIRSLGRDLRQRLAPELRAEAEESERLAAIAALRRRALADVAAEAGARGEQVVVEVPGRRFAGRVRHAAGDLLTLELPGGERVHLRLAGPLALGVVGPPDRAADTAGDGVGSFRARLFQLELSGAELEVGAPPLEAVVRGHLVAVATDHVVVRDRDGRLHHLAGVGYVIERGGLR